MKSLKSGEFYVLRKGNTKALLCIENIGSHPAYPIYKVYFSDGKPRKIKIESVMQGKSTFTEQETPVNLAYKRLSAGKEYLRLEITCVEDGSKAVTNPVFFEAVK